MTSERTATAMAEPALLVDAHRPTETVRIPLGAFNDELEGGDVEVAIEDGGLVVTRLNPEGHALYRAMPNDGIEHHVRLAIRALLLATPDRPLRDVDGRRVSADGCVLYPGTMEEAPGAPRAAGVRRERMRALAALGAAAVLFTLALVATGQVHPLVMLLIPGVGIGAWSVFQATRGADAGLTAMPDYPIHLRRGRAQARSISRAASRARGLST